VGVVLPGEGAVRRGQSPPGLGPVHEIIVYQGAGLVELERRTQMDGIGTDQALGPVLRSAQECAADRAQHGAHALAPVQDAPRGIEHLRNGPSQVLPASSTAG